MSLAAVVASTRDRLARAGVASPAVDAEMLVAWVLGLSRSELLVRVLRGDEAGSEIVDALEPIVLRRESREPLQHLMGSAPFMTFELEVGPGVFVPRPETQSLAEHAIAHAQNFGVNEAGVSILDLCSGSGALAIALARAIPWANVSALEASAEACSYLERNVAALAPDVKVVHSSVAEFAGVVTEHSVDMIVANPPYVPEHQVPNEPEVADFDPPMALFGGPDGLDVVRDIVALALDALRPGGILLMEHSNLQGAEVAALLVARGFRLVATEQDLVGRDRFTHGVLG
jgi:release factor glutamine methyltransferase